MSLFQKRGFIIVIVLQLAVLSFMIVKRVQLLETGKVVRLKCVPVDPRSLFSGDYVILNYKISSFSSKEFAELNRGEEKFKKHDTVYVALVKQENTLFWDAVEVSRDIEKIRKNYETFIRGELLSTYRYRIKYGVEEYFVPQNEGRKIEKKIKDVSVEVALSDSGESGIKRLFMGESEIRFY